MGRHALLALLVFSVIFLSFASKASADGCLHIYDPDLWPGGMLQPENRQLAAINYENGRENLIVAVDVENLAGKQAAWIFPVPASPEETSVDIVKGFPAFYGTDTKNAARTSAFAGFMLMSVSQIYPAPMMVIYLFGGFFVGSAITASDLARGGGIEVYEHVERMGLTTELVTAQDGSSLDTYLSQKGASLPAESKAVLDGYVGQKYSFVVSWISDVEKFKNESRAAAADGYYGYHQTILDTLGVYVSFPSEKMYFPLKPTSVYGSAQIPIAVYAVGHVTPELFQGIESAKTNYFIQPSFTPSSELSQFFNGRTGTQELKYTKIEINAPSSAFTGDLWISDSPPRTNGFADFVTGFPLVWIAGIFLLASCAASVLSGIILFGKEKIDVKFFALLGLANLLSIIGLIMASGRLDAKYGKQSKTRKISDRAKRTLLAAGIVIAFLALVAFALAYLSPNMSADHTQNFSMYGLWPGIFLIFALALLLLIPGAIGCVFPAVFLYVFAKKRSTKEFVVLFSAIFMAIVLGFWGLFALLIG